MIIVRLFFLLTILSCQGYRFKKTTNPFIQYDVRSVSVPVFINKSNLPDVSEPLTREIVRVLAQFPNLSIRSGLNKNADAVLLGVITSAQYSKESVKPKDFRFTTGKLQDSIGKREPHFIPKNSIVTLQLELTLIKNPTSDELNVFQSKLGEAVAHHHKIVFREVILLSQSFAVSNLPTAYQSNGDINPDSAGIVNFTQTRGSYKNAIDALALNGAKAFKDLVLYAF